jgi:hypothetical protein
MYTILRMTYVTSRAATFTLVFSRDGPVSDSSLHMHAAPRFVLWVVTGSSSLATLVLLRVLGLCASRSAVIG